MYYLLIAAVFTSNILILFLAPDNIGFGNIGIALIGLVIALVGFIFWLGGMISLGSGFSLFPKPKKFVTSGFYHLTKHPIYFGMFLALTGLAIAKGSLVAVLFTMFVTTPLNIFRAKKEEQALKEKFGVEYK